MKNAFYMSTEMTVSGKFRLPWWDSVRATDPRVAQGCPKQHDFTHCMCSGLHNKEAAKQLDGGCAPPQLFSGMRKLSFGCFTGCFSWRIFDMPSVFAVTGHLVSGCCAGLCRQARVLAGSRSPSRTGTVTRNVKIAAWAERLWLRTHFATTFKVSIGLTLAVL